MNSKNQLQNLAKILATNPKGSAKYRKALKELDKLLEMPSELESEGESYDDAGPENDR